MFGKIVLLSASVITVIPGTRAVKPRVSNVNIQITPLIYQKASYIVVKSEGSTSAPSTISVSIKNDFYPEGVLLFTHEFTELSTYTYEYDNSYTADSNTISIVYSHLGETPVTYNKLFSVTTPSSKVLGDDKQITSENIMYIAGTKGWLLKPEVLTFEGFDELYMPDFYHKIDIGSFVISQSGPFTERLILENANFLISNESGAFSGLNSSSKWAQIKLTTVKEEDGYHLAFNERLYVDPVTLKMHTKKLTGCVPTKYLYLPRNEMKNQGNYTCGISLGEVGVSRSKVIHYFKLNATINLFGDCVNSEYCIGVTIK